MHRTWCVPSSVPVSTQICTVAHKSARERYWGTVLPRKVLRRTRIKIDAMPKMPMPANVSQLRSLLGGLSHNRMFLLQVAARTRPIKKPVMKGREVCAKYSGARGSCAVPAKAVI